MHFSFTVLKLTSLWRCDLQMHEKPVLSHRTPVPAGIIHLQPLQGYSKRPNSVIADGHWSIFVPAIRTRLSTGAPVTSATPLLLIFSVNRSHRGVTEEWLSHKVIFSLSSQNKQTNCRFSALGLFFQGRSSLYMNKNEAKWRRWWSSTCISRCRGSRM